MDWRSRAACRAMPDPEAFFKFTQPALIQQVIQVYCRRCPVTDDCLEYADSVNADFGVWGGLTEEERKVSKLRRSPWRAG